MNALVPIAPKIAPLVRMLSGILGGESLTACRAIGRTINSADRDFHYLAAVNEGGAEPQLVILYRDHDLRGETEPETCKAWRDLARHLEHFGGLRPLERHPLLEIKRWRGALTPKQMKWLLAITEALGVDRRVP